MKTLRIVALSLMVGTFAFGFVSPVFATDSGLVLGTQTVTASYPVSSYPTVKTNTGTSTTSNTTTTAKTDETTNTGVTSPIVIICLVAGAILIIGLLIFLFFRGNNNDEK